MAPGPNGDGLFQAAAGGGDSMNDNQVVNEPGTRLFDPATDEPYIYDSASQTFSTFDDPAAACRCAHTGRGPAPKRSRQGSSPLTVTAGRSVSSHCSRDMRNRWVTRT